MKVHTKVLTIILAASLLIILIARCSENKNESISVRVGYSPLILNLPLMVAFENKYFQENNLEISLEKMPSTNTMRDAVSNGNVNIAVALGTEMMIQNNALEGGNLFALFFNTLSEDRYSDAIITNIDSPINSLEDLDNKKIGGYPSSTVKAFLEIISTNTSVNFEIISTPPNEALQYLATGNIDAMLVLEPQLVMAMKTGKYKIVEEGLVGKRVLENVPIGVYAVNGSYYENNKNIVLKFQSAIEKAVAYIESEPEQAIKLGEKFLGAEAGTYKDVKLPTWKSGCFYLNEESFNDMLLLYKEHNIISSVPSPPYNFICPE